LALFVTEVKASLAEGVFPCSELSNFGGMVEEGMGRRGCMLNFWGES